MNRSTLVAIFVVVASFLALPCCPLMAQDKNVSIEPYRLPLSDRSITAKAKALKDAGKLLSRDKILAQMKSPEPASLKLPRVSTKPLDPRDIAARARKSLVRIGWFYLCPRCTKWHLNVAGGYAITADGAVATCYHVLAAKGTAMREGYLIALNSDNDVLPVTAVLARDSFMDVGIVRVAGKSPAPLALNDRVAPGDSVYLYSDPMRVAGYFSTGMVNRFFWRAGAKPANPATLSGARGFRMHVSTDWAPGSSGAPVLDAFGNAVGHVAVISSLKKTASRPAPRPAAKPSTKPATKDADGDDHEHKPLAPTTSSTTMITLHEAVPARAVKLLAESLVTKAKKSPTSAPAAR